MKKFNAFVALIIIASLLLSTGCSKSLSGFSSSEAQLKIGVDKIAGEFNPFYSENEDNSELLKQIYIPVLQETANNTLTNFCGGISYEYVENNQVKYTITIRDDLRFSNGEYATIQDIIEFFYYISDATYTGAYKDWYLNDIVGLKEYYFDDKNYADSISLIENIVKSEYSIANISTDDFVDYLVETSLDGNYQGGVDSASPSGESWREYFVRFQYSEELEALGTTPSDEDVLMLAAKVEAEQNPYSYNPENWYREKLYKEYIEKNYSDGINVTQISGIKKVNDYTCTVLFNSENINAISQINVPIISAEHYLSQYMKGKAEEMRESDGYLLGCGPYYISEYSDGEAILAANDYYFNGVPEFLSLKFIDLSLENKSAEEFILSGKLDVAETFATDKIINSLNGNSVKYFVNDYNGYVSAFFNPSNLTLQQRMALMGLCSLNTAVEKTIGSYFTGLKRPLSVRFKEYPSNITEPFYKESAYTAFMIVGKESLPAQLNAYYCGDSLEEAWLKEYKEILSSKGVNLNIYSVTADGLNAAIDSGKADLWLSCVDDGATCDKYDWYNTNGSKNILKISNPEIDALTTQIRSAVGFTDKTALTEKVLELIMEQAVECPLYQRQTVVMYNTENISEESFTADFNHEGFAYSLSELKR